MEAEKIKQHKIKKSVINIVTGVGAFVLLLGTFVIGSFLQSLLPMEPWTYALEEIIVIIPSIIVFAPLLYFLLRKKPEDPKNPTSQKQIETKEEHNSPYKIRKSIIDISIGVGIFLIYILVPVILFSGILGSFFWLLPLIIVFSPILYFMYKKKNQVPINTTPPTQPKNGNTVIDRKSIGNNIVQTLIAIAIMFWLVAIFISWAMIGM